MPRRKINYKEGDWISVPLRDGNSYAIGKIVRVAKSGILLGYFFGPSLDHIPTESDITNLTFRDAILIVRFGDQGLVKYGWQVVSRPENWSRDEWPMPDFVRIELLRDKVWKVTYDENDLQTEISQSPWPKEMAAALSPSGLYGDGAVEIDLTHLLKADGQD